MNEPIKGIVTKVLNEYANARQETFAGHALGAYFRSDIPNLIYNTGLVDSASYLITGSVGQGNWAAVPWVCIFDRKITTSATKGVYIVYLLSKDCQSLYLTFNQGCTDIRNANSKKETIKIMREKAADIVSLIDSRGFASDENINLGDNLTPLAELYQKGTIFYKEYRKDNIPEEAELREDLAKMMSIYQEYALLEKAGVSEWFPARETYSPGLSKDDWMKLLIDPFVFTESALEMIAEVYAFGGVATCAQLANHYNKTYQYYLMTSVHLAERVVKVTNCPVYEGEKNSKWWPVLYVGKDAGKEEQGTFIWKIRDELYEALTEFGIDKYLKKLAVDSRFGTFDSWEIVDENTAIKHCDKSFFDYRGSGVPKGICWFFGAEGMELGENKSVKLLYNGAEYQGSVKIESMDRRRVRIFWSTELGNLFEAYNVPDATATFKRVIEDTYEVVMKGGEKEMTVKEKVDSIKAYIAAEGFNYEGDMIENFYLSLKSKPFVILAGTSGTGKTRLVKLFAKAIGAKIKLVPVRPDWSDSSDLFGYTDLSNEFHPGAIIDFVKQAEGDKNTPYFLCLDEMNLARVEYYLSDFLSVIETRDRNADGIIKTDSLVDDNFFKTKEVREKYSPLYIPENLYIVGTVNMDETTFPFSKKVLDRANTIEFSYVNLMNKAAADGQAVSLQLDNSFLKTDYLKLHECEDQELVDEVCSNLEGLNQILVKANLHVGYRVRDEISFYMANNKRAELLAEDVAFDHEIMQKILPRVQGSSASIKKALSELFIKCAGDYTGFSGAATYEQMDSYLESKNCRYPNSAKKIAFMMRRYEEDGFTSYWI